MLQTQIKDKEWRTIAKLHHSTRRQKRKEGESLWKDSKIAEEQRKNLEEGHGVRVAFLDIDATLVAGNDEQTSAAINALREQNFSLVLLSSRPIEWQMRDATYQKSVEHDGFDRPRPPRLLSHGKRVSAEEAMPKEILDPDIMGGSNGTQIAVLDRSEEYYRIDKAFTEQLETQNWRLNGYELIKYIKVKTILSDIDHSLTFSGREKIPHKPHDFKIACHFATTADKQKFRKHLERLKNDSKAPQELRKFARNIELIDDSHPNRKIEIVRSVSETGQIKKELITDYTIHLVPLGTGKEHATDHILQKLSEQLHIGKEQMSIFLAGDSYQDLKMGLEAGCGAGRINFIIPGGSRLYDYIVQGRQDYGGEDFSTILDSLTLVKNMTRDGARKYLFTNENGQKRNVYLYPREKKGPASIISAVNMLYQ